jgi:fused signal recognition particle receptor
MSPFNWFNRKYNEPDQKSQTEETTETASPAAEEATETEAASEAETAIAQDYLTWAKAAYQNIQKRQQTTPDTETGTDAASEPEPDTAAPIAQSEPMDAAAISPAEAAQADVAPPAEAPPEVVEAIEAVEEVLEQAASSEAAVQAPETTEPIAEAPVSEPIEAIEAEPQTTPTYEPTDPVELIATTEANTPVAEPVETALPFWARAEAERQERLERVRAEAIEEPEPEVPVTTSSDRPESTTVTTEAPAIAFDESFLWSAEVLAAQGRRPEEISVEEITWLKRLRQGLDKTRRNLVNQLRSIVGQGPLNQDAVMEIESLLLQADVGVEATDYIINALQSKLRQEALPPSEAIAYLKTILRDMLDKPFEQYNPTFAPEKDTLTIWLITGVNGAGKTTTIGKIAHLAQKSDYRCLIAAADTFRAAAVEQVKIWGQRSNVDVIANPGKNTDPAAVVYDAIEAARSRKTELLLVDTAGRLQNKKNLMDELSKIRRIIDKKASEAHIESLLVLDATLGQNGLRQAEVFSEAAQLSGVVLTKLDGTAKGGIALAVVQQLGLPIRFIGAGEGIEDLRPFSSYEFVEALLNG